jgi:hypothetical protein
MASIGLFQPPGMVGRGVAPWYLPVTYRRDPLSIVYQGQSAGLGRAGLAGAGLGAFARRRAVPAVEQDPWAFMNYPAWEGAADVAATGALAPEQLGAFAPGGRFAPGGMGYFGQPVTPITAGVAGEGRVVGGALRTVGGPPGARAPTHGGRWPVGPQGPQVPGAAAPTGPAPDERAGTAGGPQFRDPIDPRIDTAWYHAFQAEHDMQTPEAFYTGIPMETLLADTKRWAGAMDMALGEALDDLEWSRGFQRMTGEVPTDDDWKAWWMQNYGRDMRTDEERRRDRIARKGGGGRKLPRFRGKGQEEGQRPPLWVPPVTYWR